MEQIKFNLPRDVVNTLNNFYLEQFGYDIRTQLYNFVYSEYQKCENKNTSTVPAHPHPLIVKNNKGRNYNYLLRVYYDDYSSSQISCNNFEEFMDYLNEWSKYGFERKMRQKICDKKGFKYKKKKPDISQATHIRENSGKFIVEKQLKKDGKFRHFQFGTFSSFEDAVIVRDFLVNKDWDLKYHSSDVKKVKQGIHQYNYSDYILRIAKGEVEL